MVDKLINDYKIDLILLNELKGWIRMEHYQLLDLLLEQRRFFLETEVDQGNEEYLDEILEEF
jgi:hypothetical protein